MTLEVVDGAAFAAVVPAAAHIYGAAMNRSPELVVQRREIMNNHVHRRGFVAVLARADDRADGDDGPDDTSDSDLVGFGYGYHGRPGEWWHDVVAKALGRADARRWLDDAFELAELHVSPPAQGAGLGRQLLETLLARAEGRTVVLSTNDRDSPARALYRSVGFVDLLSAFVFPGSAESYAIMGLERAPLS